MFSEFQWRKPMNASKGDISFRQSDAISTSIEGVPSARGEGAVLSSETIEALVQKVRRPSVAEIDKLIGDLQGARSYLESESERIQQEMTRYAHLNDTALASVKIITESLGQWRNGNNAALSAGRSDRRVDAA